MAARIKYHLDEHIPKAVARGLHVRGVDVTTARDVGLLGASDEDHLTWSRSKGRVVVTKDEDFLRLAALTPDHAGIAFAFSQTSIGQLVVGLMLIHDVLEPSEMVGHVEYL